MSAFDYVITHNQAADGEIIRLNVAGEIDRVVDDDLRATISRALQQSPREIVVDLAAVTFLDSSGISTLMRGYRAATAAGCRLKVVNAQGIVRRVLQVTGTLDVLAGPGPPTAV